METYEWYNNRMVSKHNMSKAKTQQQQHHGAEIHSQTRHTTRGGPSQRQTTSTVATLKDW